MKYRELENIKRLLQNPDSAYAFIQFSTDEYSEEDFNFLTEIETTVDFKFRKGVLFDKEIFYISTEPKEARKALRNYTVLTKPKSTKKQREGWCYLLSDGEYQKIGVTTMDLAKRVSQIQNGNPRKISIIAKYKVNTDVFYVEKKLHLFFKDNRASGEWFLSNIKEDEFIELCEEYDK